jgi:hypothetical protein
VELAENLPVVRFEGFGEGAELLGAVQMNFFVPSLDREYAISINDPAVDRAVQEAGADAESRQAVARELARLLLLAKLRDGRLEPFNFYGLRLFDEHPGIIDDLRTAIAV